MKGSNDVSWAWIAILAIIIAFIGAIAARVNHVKMEVWREEAVQSWQEADSLREELHRQRGCRILHRA